MTDSKKNNKKRKPRITSKGIEAGKLRTLLNELHEDEIKDRYKNNDSAKRAEDILNLIRSRQEEHDRKVAMQHWINFVEHIEKVASKKAIAFLNKIISK
jgi:hypothetical protein